MMKNTKKRILEVDANFFFNSGLVTFEAHESSSSQLVESSSSQLVESSSFELSALNCFTDKGTPSENEIWYYADEKIIFTGNYEAFNSSNLHNFEDGKGVLKLPFSLVGKEIYIGRLLSGTNITSVKLPLEINLISKSTFENCFNLTTIDLTGIKRIEDYAFHNCTNLVLTNLPESVNYVGDCAFSGCPQVKINEINTNMIFVSDYAFCDNVPEPNEIWYTADEKVTLYSEDHIISHTFSEGNGIVKFDANINSISSPFTPFRATSVKTVVYPITYNFSLYTQAFADCIKLKKFFVSNKFGGIGFYTFSNCVNLDFEYLPEKMAIGQYAFYNCSNLSSLKRLPSNLNLNYHNPVYPDTQNTCFIDEGTFSGCSNLELTELPENISTICREAFSGCTNLKLSILPSGLTKIWDRTFYNCSSLALTELPESVTSINTDAFRGCTSLALTKLPSNLGTIYDGVFYDCVNMTLESYTWRNKTWSVIPCCEIGNVAFHNCKSLKNVIIKPITLDWVRCGYDIFDGCTNIENIYFWCQTSYIGEEFGGAVNATVFNPSAP